MAAKTKKQQPMGIDSELVKVLAHPARWYALDILNQRVASPKELAGELGIEVGLMSYHVKELRKKGFVELVDEQPRRGAVEHYYRANRRAFFTDAEWEKVPGPLQARIVGNQFAKTAELFRDAVESGSFEARGDRHHTLCEAKVDEQGWSDAMALLEETLNRLMEIQGESAERRIASDSPGIPMAVSLLGFEKAAP